MGTKDKVLYEMRKKLVLMDSFIETLLDEVGDAVYYQDKDLIYRFFNDDYLRLVNKKEDEVHGHDIFNVFPRKEAKGYHDDDLQVLRDGKRKSYEQVIVQADGSNLVLEVIKRPHIGKDGEIIGIFGIIRDITDLRENQRQLNMLDQVKKVFLDINRNILKHQSEHEFFDDIQMEIQSVFEQCKQSSVLAIDAKGEMRILVHRGYVDYEAGGFHMPLTESYFYKHRKGNFENAFYVNDVQSYMSKETLPVVTSEVHKPVMSSLCIPLVIEDRLKYIISVDSSNQNAFNEIDRLVAEFISKELPIIYRIFELHQETLKLSRFDELTGLYNRRTFNLVADQKVEELDKGEQLSMVLIDMDNLKKVNDRYGHLAGDQYIKDLVELISTVQNNRLKFGRIGGDEFAGVFVGYDEDSVEEIMNQLQSEFAETDIMVSNRSFNGSFSYGAAHIHSDGYDRSTLMKVADLRMYKNKHQH